MFQKKTCSENSIVKSISYSKKLIWKNLFSKVSHIFRKVYCFGNLILKILFCKTLE